METTAFVKEEYSSVKVSDLPSFEFKIDANERFEFSIEANSTINTTYTEIPKIQGEPATINSEIDNISSLDIIKPFPWIINITIDPAPGYSGTHLALVVKYSYMTTTGRWISYIVIVAAAIIGIFCIYILFKDRKTRKIEANN